MSTKKKDTVQPGLLSTPPAYKLHVTKVTRLWRNRFFYRNAEVGAVYYFLDIEERAGLYSDDIEERRKIKGAFALLRKVIKAYRHTHEYISQTDWFLHDLSNSTSGDCWCLHKDLLLHFADWFQFEAPLEDLMREADAWAIEQRIKYEQYEQERKRQEEENAARWQRWYYSGNFGYCPRSNVDDALSAFGLSEPVTKDDIKRKYRELAKKHHPDLGGNEAEFKRINNANRVLMSAF